MGEMHRERTGPGTYHPPRRPAPPDEACGDRHMILAASAHRYRRGRKKGMLLCVLTHNLMIVAMF